MARSLRSLAKKKKSQESPATFQSVWDIVRRVPKKRVATYGQISMLLDNRLSPLAVSWALSAARKNHRDRVPWQRVVNGDGSLPERERASQCRWLRADGVPVAKDGHVDLERYGWRPQRAKTSK